MAVAGNLEVQVTLAIARLEQEMAQVRKVVGDGMREVGGHAHTAADSAAFLADALKTVGLAFSADKLVSGFLDLEKSIQAVGESAKSIGMSLSDFQGFAYAFKIGGVESEQFGAAMGRLDKAIADAAGGGKAQQAIFQALGVSYTDASGNARELGQVLLDVAQSFHSHADGAAKTQIAIELFGRAGRLLVPTLNEGSAAMQEMSEKLGLVGGKFSDAQVEQAHKFSAELTLIGAEAKVTAANLAGPLATAIEEVMRHFNEARAAGEGFWSSWVHGVNDATMKEQIAHLQQFIETTKKLTPELQASMGVPAAKAQLWLLQQPPDPNVLGHYSSGFVGPQQPMQSVQKDLGADKRTDLEKMIETLQKQTIQTELGKTAWERYELALANLKAPNQKLMDQGLAMIGQQEQSIAVTERDAELKEKTKQLMQDIEKQGALDDAQRAQGLRVDEYALKNYQELAAAQKQVAVGYVAERAAQRELLEIKMQDEYVRQTRALGDNKEALDALKASYDTTRAAAVKLFDEQTKAARTWEKGWSDAFIGYSDAASDNAAHARDVFETTTRGMEDMFVEFVQSGKINFKSFADSIIAEIARIEAKKMIASLMGGSSDSSGGNWAGMLAGIIGMFGGAGSGTAGMTSGGSAGMLGGLMDSGGGAAYYIGGHASGGDISGPSIVGERGPELFIPRGAGSIVPNEKLGTQIAFSPQIHIDSRSDQSQILAIVQQQLRDSENRMYESMRRRGAFATGR